LNVLNATSGNGRSLGELRVIGLGGLHLETITLVGHLIREVWLLQGLADPTTL